MPAPPKSQHPQLHGWLRRSRIDSITRFSVPELQETLDWAASESRASHDAVATYLLSHCIGALFGKDDPVHAESLFVFLLETTDADLVAATRGRASITLYDLFSAYARELVHVHGRNTDQRLRDIACVRELMVGKLLELDATVEHDFPEPILETCARLGSLAMFKLLRDRGAQVTRRVVHKAAQGAAYVGADPSSVFPTSMPSRLQDRVDVLSYLVEECNMDVNELDDEVGDPIGRFGYWGTPLSYAASEARGVRVVTWLLDRGADQSIKKGSGKFDASWAAKFQGNFEVFVALETWRKRQEAEGEGSSHWTSDCSTLG